jgi:uncharacterized protein
MYFERDLVPPKTSFFLFGCRGVGKSFWVRRTFPQAKEISLLDETLYQSYLSNPALFANELRVLPKGSWVFVDEIQRLPQLLNEVHRGMEDLGLKFILCGSSARKLRRAGVNLLGGRALQLNMLPLLPTELGAHFDMNHVMEVGSLPLILKSDEPKLQLQAYAQTYLREEVQAEALVRNLPGFSRFLPIAALMHGQTMNISNVARDAEVARTTAQSYFDVLEETLLTFKISGYESRLRVKERKLPKVYWVDPGIVRGILKNRVEPDSKGALFEGLVATLLRANQFYRQDFCDEIFYWSPAESHNTEVDFLVVKGRKKYAVEVKSGEKFKNDWTKGLRAIEKLEGLQKRIIVIPTGNLMKTEDGIEIMDFVTFSRELLTW